MKEPLLRVDRLGKDYYTAGRIKRVLRDISFSLRDGEFVSLLGPSGCGKTTLLKCLASFIEPTEGSILVEGKKVKEPGPDRIMIFQDFNQLFPWKKVRGNLFFPLSLQIKDKEELKKRKADSLEILRSVGLSDSADYYPHTLSGGMKQRAVIARALSLSPKILLMDEPFCSLDVQIRASLQDLLVSLWKERKLSILFVTHDLQEALILSQRVLVLSSDGKIKAEIENPLPEYRHPETEEFRVLLSRIHSEIDSFAM